VKELLDRPYGILLVTGPTGSGKTTTLYAALNKINTPDRNIMTIEDPVELKMPYVRQIQVRADIGLTFASALRSVLRQDPDVVLVGEIRDEETANIALQAALTGHLVLATLHTNDAAGGIARLRDFEVAPFIINSAVLGIVAQRLVRRVCTACTAPDEPSPVTLVRFGLESGEKGLARGAGCGRCGQTGYRGRIGIFELLRLDSELQLLIEEGRSTREISEEAVSHGMRLMWQDGLEKARSGLTTLDEVGKAAAINLIGQQLAERKSA
jgi:type II secretory ATPase GspE/PulE/Tfp pilus assembly ATPase PilB-like protein